MPRRFIAAAAVKYNGVIYTGWRHATIMKDIWDTNDPTPKILSDQQGFITDLGEFVNRWQAGVIAFDAGQTKVRHTDLLSEYVWDVNGKMLNTPIDEDN